MYCGKCGAKNESGAAFCGSCGAPLGEKGSGAAEAVEVNAKPASGQSASKNKKIGMIAVAAAVIALVVAAFPLFGGRSDMETAEQFVDAVFDMDTKEILNLLPKDVIRVLEERGYDKAELMEELGSLAREAQSTLLPMNFLGGKIEIDNSAVDASSVEGDQLTALQDRYQTEVGMKITAAREVNVSMRIRIKDLGIDTQEMMQVPVVKSGGTWYIDAINL